MSTSSAVGMLPAFPYKPLHTEKAEVRMLRLPARDSNDFELITVSLDDDLEYAALSYVWGGPEDQNIITVQGHEVLVPENLIAALSRLRRGPNPLQADYLWADAICIDQTNLTERSQQVQLMSRIYSSAVVVYSWVGPNDYTLAFETLTTLSRVLREKAGDKCFLETPTFQLDWLRQHRNLCDPKDEPGSPHRGNPWQAITSLVSERYWKRVWVFQEVVLARRLLLLSPGDMLLDWEVARLVTDSIRELTIEIITRGQSIPKFMSQQAWTFIQNLEHWSVFIPIMMGKHQMELRPQERVDYSGWIVSSMASRLEATDPRDYIYGLLGVTMIPISPVYGPEKSLSELFVEYVAGWLNATCRRKEGILKPLSFLSVAGVRTYDPYNLPSWVPNYPENARLKRPQTFTSVSDDFLGDPIKKPYVYKDTRSLFVWGSNIGPVDTISEGLLAHRLEDFYSFLKAISALLLGQEKTKPVTATTVRMALEITVFAPHFEKVDRETTKEPPWHHQWETSLYEVAFPGSDMQELGFTRTPQEEVLSWYEDECSQILLALDQELREYNFFESESGYLGRAPLEAKRGDILCLLDGHGNPVLLRETKEGHHVFVGTVTVLDLDIHSLLLNMGSEAQWLELR